MAGVAILGSASAGVNVVTTSQHSIIIDRNETSSSSIDDMLEDYSYIYDVDSDTSTLEFTSNGVNNRDFPAALQDYMWAVGAEGSDFELSTPTYDTGGSSNSRGIFAADLTAELASKAPSKAPTSATPTSTPTTNQTDVLTVPPTTVPVIEANQTNTPTSAPTTSSRKIGFSEKVHDGMMV
jgi:hypothetical protein